MALDYSRFDAIHDSDSDGGDGGHMDIANLLSGLQSREEDGNHSREVPEDMQERIDTHQPSPLPPPAFDSIHGDDAAASAPPPPTLDRFIDLIQGGETSRADDSLELQAAARATVQSVLGDTATECSAEVASRFVRSVTIGLSRRPKPVPFAREQAPEFVAELLMIGTSGWVPIADIEHVLDLLVKRCRIREVYTFLLEALCGNLLGDEAKLRGVVLLQSTLWAMDDSKRHCFLGSSLPVLLKQFAAKTSSVELSKWLDALRGFSTSFAEGSINDDCAGNDPAKVVRAMVSAFLFKALECSYPAMTVEGLELAAAGGTSSATPAPLPPSEPPTTAKSEPGAPWQVRCGVGAPSPAASCKGRAIRLRVASAAAAMPATAEQAEAVATRKQATSADIASICAVALSAAETSPKSLLRMFEDINLSDPTGDGGGDLEVSPLSLAVYVCLLELHGCWRALQPQVLPLGISAARRAGIMMRAAFVLVSKGACTGGGTLSLADLGSGEINCEGKVSLLGGGDTVPKQQEPRWAQRGLALFARAAVPLLSVALAQTPQVFASLDGPLCRWYPDRVFQAILEALVSTADIDREVRGAIFFRVISAVRLFAWPCRFDLYLTIVKKCRVDSVIGAIVTTFKDDWWPRVLDLSSRGESLEGERSRLVKVLEATLAGDVKIVDGMDTLTAALNTARLVVLSRTPAGFFMRAALRKGGSGVDLEAMLGIVSSQIDIELSLLNEETGESGSRAGSALASELARQLGSLTDNGMDVNRMKGDRITMVAHLVARVRELLSEAAD